MAKAANSEQKAKKQERRDAAKKASDKKARQHKAIFIGIIVVLLAFAALIIVYNVKTGGSAERSAVVASSENFEVTQSMMTFFFNSSYNQYANSYSSSTDYLNELIDSVNERGTYYDVILSSTKSNVEQYLTVAEMAKAAGVELDSEDMDEIDATIDAYKETKKSYGESNNAYQIMSFDRFLESMFGESVNESVVRDCLELTQLVSKYQEKFLDECEYTDEQLEEYYAENKDSYTYVDFLKYQFTEPADETVDVADDADADADTEPTVDAEEAGDGEDAIAGDDAGEGEDLAEGENAEDVENVEENEENAEDVENAEENEENAEDVETEPEVIAPAPSETRALAEELAATKSVDEFNEFMTGYLTKEAEAALAEDEELDTDKVKSDVEALAKTKQLKGNITGDEAKEWAFDAATKVGDTKLIVDEEAGTYTVYMLTKTAYRDEEITKKAAIIYLTDTNNDGDSAAKAEEIKAEWDAGEKSEEAFIALSEKYSESSHHHVDEGYTKDTSYIGEWFYEDGREVGDVGVISPENSGATYIIYFAGDGAEAWKASCKSAKSSDDFDDAVAEYKKTNNKTDSEDNPSIVTFDEEIVKKITPIVLTPKSDS